jgi:beta-phosphoglucomutase
MELKAILFDVDGTLCDTTDIHYRSLNKALEDFEQPKIGEVEHYHYYNGLPTRVKLEILTSTKGLSVELHRLILSKKQFYTHAMLVTELQKQEDKIQLLTFLKSIGLMLGACSNAIQASTDAMLEGTGIHHFFDIILSNESISNPKPAPDIYLKAAKCLNTDISLCAIVEDSDIGLKSAIAANPRNVVKVKDHTQVNLNLLSKLLL